MVDSSHLTVILSGRCELKKGGDICSYYQHYQLGRFRVGDTTDINTKVLCGEFLGVAALQTPMQKNHYMHEMGPFCK